MNNMHKKIRISLHYKMLFCCILLILYGIYKNGILPFREGFSSLVHVFNVISYPIIGFVVGFLFDFFFKHNYLYPYWFYGLLFSMVLPISTPLFLYLILLLFLFLVQVVLQKKDIPFHILTFAKLLLVFFLLLLHTYDYANSLEHSSLYVYSYLDQLMGNHVDGLFISNVFLLLFSFIFFSFDFYYKKEIPIYSYGVYFLTLLFYSFLQKDILFFLSHAFSSTILFVFIFLATLPSFSPYTKKSVFFYSLFLGGSTLLFSLIFNFQEGVYVSLFFTNLCFLLILFFKKWLFFYRNKKKNS